MNFLKIPLDRNFNSVSNGTRVDRGYIYLVRFFFIFQFFFAHVAVQIILWLSSVELAKYTNIKKIIITNNM